MANQQRRSRWERRMMSDLEAGQERLWTGPRSADRSTPWLTLLGFALLTFNSVMAICRSQGDLQDVALLGFSYVDLVLLFVWLRWYERPPADSWTRKGLKVAVWSLTTLLTIAFGYRVATVMPLPMAVFIWLMAVATLCGGFYAFLVQREQE
ncbi:unnamed protein product [Urochloa humidicola]